MPKRAAVNKALAECKTQEEIEKLSTGFIKKYGINVMSLLSGKQGDKEEQWHQVFTTHRNRVNGVPPVDANKSPNEYQIEWDTLASK